LRPAKWIGKHSRRGFEIMLPQFPEEERLTMRFRPIAEKARRLSAALGCPTRDMNSGRINLLAPFGQAECVSRLTAAIDAEQSLLSSIAALRGSKPVVGWVTESSMRLRKRIGYGNSFQSYLTATMRPEAGGTAISGKIAMHPLVRAAMIVWFGAIIYMAGAPFIRTLYLMIVGSPAEYENRRSS
jgi:hypothetical protein